MIETLRYSDISGQIYRGEDCIARLFGSAFSSDAAGDKEEEELGHKMAAAPAMYEQLKAIHDAWHVGHKTPEQIVKALGYFMEDAGSALAAARGENQ